jgi:hypothetical protein
MGHVGSPRQHLGLALLAGLGLAYVGWLAWQPTLLGSHRLDGALGVLLGLYLGSHPAAHAIDLMFLGRSARRPAGWPREAAWLALNGLVLLISLIVIIVGATRFTAGAV